MRAKIARKRTMMTAAETMDLARPLAAALVDRHERLTRSRMTAYERVAATVGVSSSWLRKLVGRQPGIVIAAHEYLNIAAAYTALCERIEAEAEKERQLYLALRSESDAALESAFPAPPMALEAQRRGTAGER